MKRNGKERLKFSECHFAAGTLHTLQTGRVGRCSLTTWVGRPYLAKILRMALMVESAVVVFDATNHFRPLRVDVEVH